MATSHHSYKESFLGWLSLRIPSDQLTDFYNAFVGINEFALQNRLLAKPLFETDDLAALARVHRAIRLKKYSNKRTSKYKSIEPTAIEYYCDYISTHLGNAEAKITPKQAGNLKEKTDKAKEAEVHGTSATSLVELLESKKIKYVDNRSKNGCLWIVGKDELGDVIKECRAAGVYFQYKEKGTGETQWWWTKGELKAPAQVSTNPTPVVEQKRDTQASMKERRVQFIDWLKNRKTPNSVILQTLAALTQCGEYAHSKRTLDKNIYLISSKVELRKLRRAFVTDPEFLQVNHHSCGKLLDAMDLLAEYISETDNKSLNHKETEKAAQTQKASVNRSEVEELLDDELFLPLRAELARQNITSIAELRGIKLWAFMNQHNLYTIATRQNVLTRVRMLLDASSIADPAKLVKLHCGKQEFEGKTTAEAYLHFCEMIARKYPLRIRSMLGKKVPGTDIMPLSRLNWFDSSLKMENPTAYIAGDMTEEQVLRAVKWIYAMCGEASREVTVEVPALDNKNAPIVIPADPPEVAGAVEKRDDTQELKPLIRQEDDTALAQKIAERASEIVLDADMEGICLDDLRDELGITLWETRKLIKKINCIVEIKGKFIHKEALVDWDDGAEQIAKIMDKLMHQNNGYIASSKLYEYAHAEMNMFLNDNDMDDERSVYDMAQHLFGKEAYQGKKYTFTGQKHISTTAEAIENNFDLCCKYADDQGGIFRYADLVEYLNQTGVKTGNLRTQMKLYSEPCFFYYDEGTLISAKNMNITTAWKEKVVHALNKLFEDVGDHILLREIQPFWFDQLPDLPGNHRWTPLLLQSVLRFYSEDLGARTIIAMDSQGMETLHTMLVQKDSPIQNFGDVVLSYLMENGIEQRNYEAEELRQCLVDGNVIQGGELINNMHKALGGDERFAWDAGNRNVKIRV